MNDAFLKKTYLIMINCGYKKIPEKLNEVQQKKLRVLEGDLVVSRMLLFVHEQEVNKIHRDQVVVGT